jgi:serine/threonine protein kinase/formylglycine-generating enzyme required for sulfatase activity
MRTCPNCQRTYPDEAEFCPRDGTALPPAMEATAAALEAGLSRRFRVVRRLGAGGMGSVFLAEQIAVGNRPVALKVLLRKLLDDPEFLLRFQNEAASTGRIRHPNVVTIYESGQSDDGSPYIAMEYLEGETLRQTLKRRGALPLAECAEVLQQIARGLNSAHKLGILHRDLTPDNIFVTRTEDGDTLVKVVDFGLAKMRESTTHTLTGTMLGTPAYMSPEQCLGMKSEELDVRSDLYALGIIAYEMLTGRVPFRSDTPIGYVHKHIMETPPPLRALSPGLQAPSQVEAVVMKALSKERDQRQASVVDLAREFAAAASVASNVDTPASTAGTRLVERPATFQGMGVTAGSGSARTAGPPDTAVATPTTPIRTSPVPAPPQPTQREAPAARPAATVPPRVAHTAPRFAVEPEKPRRKWGYALAGFVGTAVVLAGLFFYFQSAAPTKEAQPPASSSTGAPEPKADSEPPGMVYVPKPPPPPPGFSGVWRGFAMGRDNAPDPEETPAHVVNVKPFYLDKTPVTVGQYAAFTKATVPAGSEDLPATNVSWQEAQDYCASKGGRLPTEAEWEYAARGVDGRLYPWGNSFAASLTNSAEGGLGRPQPANSHADGASQFGVLGMSGNVWQWTADDYRPYPGRQPAFKIPADAKVIRGGSYKSDKDHVTTTTRNLDHASARSPVIGFRCAKSQ